MIRLIDRAPVGATTHRSGWPHAVRLLRELVSPGGILLDDFVEQTFAYGHPHPPHREPWVGIFHHPPYPPRIVGDAAVPQKYLETDSLRESLRHLRHAIVLSEYAARAFRRWLPCSVTVVRHPMPAAPLRWSPVRWRENPSPAVLQIGEYLRNTRAIHQVPCVLPIARRRIATTAQWVNHWDAVCRDYWSDRGDRREYAGVELLPRLSAHEYDAALSANVVLTELFDASANNVVLDCVVRGTPLLINPHPAVVEHLGADYPLFFERIDKVPSLLHPDTILRAHEHLQKLDKSPYSDHAFLQGVSG